MLEQRETCFFHGSWTWMKITVKWGAGGLKRNFWPLPRQLTRVCFPFIALDVTWVSCKKTVDLGDIQSSERPDLTPFLRENIHGPCLSPWTCRLAWGLGAWLYRWIYTVKLSLSNILSARGHQTFSLMKWRHLTFFGRHDVVWWPIYTVKYIWWPHAHELFDKESLTV